MDLLLKIDLMKNSMYSIIKRMNSHGGKACGDIRLHIHVLHGRTGAK
jgi:hypothetical protein